MVKCMTFCITVCNVIMKELDIPHSGILLMDAIFVSAKTVPQKRFTVFIREQMEAEPKRKEEIDLLFKNFYFCG